ncbi:MAG: alpha/beta hydrolase [Patescibacteria group bacterium]
MQSHKSISKIIHSTDGTEIYYEVLGKEHKSPSLLFLHGLGGDLTAWNKERNALYALGHSSVAVDLRGHGLSGRPDKTDAYDLKIMSQDIEEVIRHEFKKPPIIVGHCFGGMISILLSAFKPHIARGLILVDTSYKPPYNSSFFIRIKTLHHLFHLIARYAPVLHIKGHIHFKNFKNTSDYDLRRVINDIAHVSLRTYLMTVDNILEYNSLYLLKRIRIPTLIIEGSQDTVFPAPIAQELHKRIITSELKLIKGANHIVVLNNPKDLVDAIFSFVLKV